MAEKVVRAPSGQALVASDQAASRLAPVGFDPGREAWRPALIAFYEFESPWMTQKLANLRNGYPLTADDLHVIDGLAAALKVAA